MRNYLQLGCFLTLMIAVVVSVVTSLPTWFGGHLGGYRLIVHMMASGVVVILLPMYTVLRWGESLRNQIGTSLEPIAFWTMVVFGFLTIGSMFICMLPIAGTGTQREMIDLHGWLGAVLAIAVVLNLVLYRKRIAAS
ncbi:hypothetical protein SAMN06265222_104136 [Neorhodopirellula lusitana]|uniref:Uncharacterized protein n=2 Tax=Neorhodopirellula lusitana TaxID=445327 RepID=A0ABY1Q3H4_9BACT|nr:hypothetical protein SAMN06265222_104136 [Neorhodopirellula lusitana]